MKPAVDQERIVKYLEQSEVREWIETQCKSLSDYPQFCIDFAIRVLGHGFGFRKSFESQYYIHKDSRYEYHFYLNTSHGYLEINRYCSFGTKMIKSRCPIEFSRAYNQIPQFNRLHEVGYGRV
ncbi:hypothetical protein FJR38_27330 [Anabaena sp. UHCC 0253]|uniref:hypothetical protein n=1 Tax=Anabaena sp. UHCC 0253 TaxID=2590019 RepID=UPI00144690F9|nr:hypothetical protein [Anabaena sp. UHCC 0253]MTJ56093.1 hypothetical protein [Anabaena sp. UHCC 0253]